MNIKDVKTAIKIGDFVLRKKHRNKINIKYLLDIDDNNSFCTRCKIK